MAECPEDQTLIAQVKSVRWQVNYPVGTVILELLSQTMQDPTPRDKELRLLLQPDGARTIARKLVEYADALEKHGGAKQ